MELATLYSVIAMLCYGVATYAVISQLFANQGPNRKIVLSLGTVAIIAHMLGLSASIFSAGDALNFNLPNVGSLVALNIGIAITVTALRHKMSLVLPMVYGFNALTLLIFVLIPNPNIMPLDPDRLVLISHITLALLSYCILIIATLYSIQVEYINSKLKSKNLLAVNNLPPLMQVEAQLFGLLAAGVICLGLSQVMGFIFIEGFYAHERAHKQILSLLAMAVYLTVLWGHYRRGWRGHRVMVTIISASALLTLAYFGSRFVKEFLLT